MIAPAPRRSRGNLDGRLVACRAASELPSRRCIRLFLRLRATSLGSCRLDLADVILRNLVIETREAHVAASMRQKIALPSKLLKVVFTCRSAEMLGEKPVLLTHGVTFSLIPRIEVHDAPDACLNHLLHAAKARRVCRVERRSVSASPISSGAEKRVRLGVHADAHVEVLAFAQEQRVGDLRYTTRTTQLTLSAALATPVLTVRKSLRGPIEARADDPVVDTSTAPTDLPQQLARVSTVMATCM